MGPGNSHQELEWKQHLPSHEQLRESFKELHEELKPLKDGNVADYIPELKRVPPETFGAAFCLVNEDPKNGERDFLVGDADPISIQSVSKVLTMCAAIESNPDNGKYYDKFIGSEPSGKPFNDIGLRVNEDNPGGLQPSNPFINSGAMVAAALFEKDEPSPEKRIRKWLQICAKAMDTRTPEEARASDPPLPEIDEKVRDSESATGYNNVWMIKKMKDMGVLPVNSDRAVEDALKLYFSFCSVRMDAKKMSVIAATLANGGVNPYTKQRVFKSETVEKCLPVMTSCGTYDASGRTMYTIDMPVKSGVGGMIMGIIPGYMGTCIASPRLDKEGNSVRGMEFLRRLVKKHRALRNTVRLQSLKDLAIASHSNDESVSSPAHQEAMSHGSHPSYEDDETSGGINPSLKQAASKNSGSLGVDPRKNREGNRYPTRQNFVNQAPVIGF